MRFNVFEGARRIALALGVLWVLGFLAYAIFNEPYYSVSYAVALPNAAPAFVDGRAPEDDWKYIDAKTQVGDRVNVRLCFKGWKNKDGNQVIPYAAAGDGKWWTAPRYSSEVRSYVDAAAARFALTPQGATVAKERRWDARLEQWKDGALACGVGLLVGWMLVSAIGWIARGFLGIPRGKDARPSG